MKPTSAPSFFSIARYLGCITFIALGSLFLYQGNKSLAWNRINDWPAAEGTVEKAILQQSYSKGGSSFRPCISCRYFVDGKEYHCENLDESVTPRTFSQTRDAQAIMQKFSKGRKVQVFYDPKDPSSAVLRRFNPSGSYQSMGLGAFAIICGLAFFILFGRVSKPQK